MNSPSFLSSHLIFQLPTKFIRKRVIWMGKVFGHGLNMNWVGGGFFNVRPTTLSFKL